MAFLVPDDTKSGVLAKGLVRPSPDISRITCCGRGYERPSERPRMSDPATYCSSTPRIQPPAVARWHTLIHGLGTAIHETSGLKTTWHWICRNSNGTAGIL
jgi:hypothetical protein